MGAVVNEMNIDQLCGAAIARLHLNVDGFYDLSPIEYHYAAETINQKDEFLHRVVFDTGRMLAKHIWNSQGRYVSQIITDPRKIEKAPWDVEQYQSAEQMKLLFELFADRNREPKHPRKFNQR